MWGWLKDALAPALDIVDQLVPDKDKAAQMKHDLLMMTEKNLHEQMKGQMEINKTEATHRSIFVAGWRPFIGWTCGTALFQHYVLFPWLVSFGYQAPSMDIQGVSSLVTGMLGMGALRTFEKHKGVSK